MKKDRILLVNPNQMKPPVTPVALDYLAQSLEEKEFDVEALDLAFSTDADDKERGRGVKSREGSSLRLTFE